MSEIKGWKLEDDSATEAMPKILSLRPRNMCRHARGQKDHSRAVACCEQQAGKACNEEAADDMKYEYGYSTETRGAWPREEHDVEGDERRHDRVKTFIARRACTSLHTCFLKFQCWEVSFLQIPD